MMRLLKLIAAGAATIALSACTTLSTADNDAMYARAAGIIGVPAGSLTISDQVQNGDVTNFTATTAAGKAYRCTVSVAFGQVNHIDCPRA